MIACGNRRHQLKKRTALKLSYFCFPNCKILQPSFRFVSFYRSAVSFYRSYYVHHLRGLRREIGCFSIQWNYQDLLQRIKLICWSPMMHIPKVIYIFSFFLSVYTCVYIYVYIIYMGICVCIYTYIFAHTHKCERAYI